MAWWCKITMLTDKEKKAIDLLKNIDKQKCLMLNCPVVNNNIERQLKIIELNRIIRKQSKEIEKLKDKCKELIFEKQELTSALLDSIPNDKIKAKIEEVEQWELYNMKIPRLSTLDERLGAKIGIKYVLQSLLEKE